MNYEFPDTYEDFLEDQQKEVQQLDIDALNFARYLKENINNNKVQNMDLESAVPCDTAGFYYYNGKIVIFNYR